MAATYPYLSVSTLAKASPCASRRGVSTVARSASGFASAYKRAGSSSKLTEAWKNKRNGFIARHVAQLKKNKEPLWDNLGNPTRRHLALIMWAYSPDPRGVSVWLKRRGVRKYRFRRNVDPVTAIAQATSLAYNLAVARDLGKLTRKNPRSRKNVDWGDLIATGAGTAIGSTIGSAIAEPVVKHVTSKKRKNVEIPENELAAGAIEELEHTTSMRTARQIAVDHLKEDPHYYSKLLKCGLMDSKKAKAKIKGRRKNPTLLIASNPGGKKIARKPRGFDEKDPAYQAALKKYREFFKNTDPVEIIEVKTKVPMPKYVVALGRAPEVTYKPGNHTPKKGVPFLHKFGEEGGKEPYLVTDPSGKYLAYVDGTFRVRDWIIN